MTSFFESPESLRLFMKVADDMVIGSDNDRELKEGLQFVDIQARKRKISFYTMLYLILHSHDINL